MNTEHNTRPTDEVRIELARTLAENAKPWSFGPDIVDAVMSRFDVRLRGVTPPADDVREALALCIIIADGEPQATTNSLVDAILRAFEVRPRHTVTDSEVEWEYGVRHVAVDGWPTELAHASLEDARTDLATCGWNCTLIRRRAAQDAGKWEPLGAEREARS